ncbi:MAG: hypothetical protein ABFS86_14840, partial [Planctomycetota bacterium]
MLKNGTILALIILLGVTGCTTSSESAQADDLTAHVGEYGSPPARLQLKRAGVPKFLDASPKEKAKESAENLGALAADQATTLLVNSYR